MFPSRPSHFLRRWKRVLAMKQRPWRPISVFYETRTRRCRFLIEKIAVTRQLCQLGCRNRVVSFIGIKSSFLADISIAIFEFNPKGNYFACGRAACFQYISCSFIVIRRRWLLHDKERKRIIYGEDRSGRYFHVENPEPSDVANISRAPRNFVAHFVDAATLLHFRLFVDSTWQVRESPTFQGHARKRDEHFIHHRKDSVISQWSCLMLHSLTF